MLYLVSSNQKKLKEFQEIIPEISIKSGVDLKEVLSNSLDVIIYKVIELGLENHIVEDSILEIFINEKWTELVDIKFLLKENNLKKFNNFIARWTVSLGVNIKDDVYIYKGEIEGKLDFDKFELQSFGFDSFFIPKDSNLTLHELDQLGLKINYSARKNALINLKNNKIYYSTKKNDIPKWEGEYQK